MRIDVKLTARLFNADKCREGEVAETDVVFPTTKAAIQEALKAVGVDGIRCRNVFLIEHDSNLSGFCHCLNQSDSVDELNYLCHLLSDMTDTELATFRAVVEYGAHNENAAALINLALNVESYDFYAGVDSDKELGRIYVEDMGTIDVPEEVRPFFDYAAYGRKVREDDKGCFVNGGYLMRSGLAFREHYHGPEDIPKEYRVFAFPKLSIRERLAVCQEMSDKTAQHSRPVPEAGRDDR